MKNKQNIATVFYKILCFTIFFNGGLYAHQFEQASYDKGQARVFEVMYKGFGGIEQANKKIKFAETKNLKFDLNLPEISARFGCKTKMGKAFISFFLDKAISSQDQTSTIKHRQQMIAMFVNHPELLEKFEKLIEQAVAYEAVLMQFMEKRFVLDPNGNPIKFIKQLWQSHWPLLTWEQLSSGQELYLAPERIADKLGKVGVSWNDVSFARKALLTGLSLPTLQSYLYQSSNFNFALQDALRTSWYGLMAGYGLYNHYTEALEMRNSLYALNRLINISQEIEAVCQQYEVEHQFKVSAIQSQAGRELLDGLLQDRYQEKDSYLFLTPAVYTFMHQVYEADIYLAPIYGSIAEIDAYVAIAKKMIELQNSDYKFCFTQFLDAKKPTIQAQGFWNMLVSTDKVVSNDLVEDRNIILTGSNEGGKTTAIRAILQNIVLAQTFGIAAATEFKLTQFDVIHSFLNVSDDILQGKSRFASELKQAQDILQRIQALQPHEKFFFAFDELFTGTNGEDGADCAYRFIDNIASYSNIQFIYATHFNKLKTIGATNPACANYKIEPPLRNDQGHFIRDDKGQLIYPYKLSSGANDINVAMDRAESAGIFGTHTRMVSIDHLK